MKNTFLLPAFIALAVFSTFAADTPPLERMTWQLDGVTREALVYFPVSAKTQDSPLLFDFHGHGGTARFAATRHNFQKLWPEAICVYMQGLPAAGKTDPEGTKNGWQQKVGDLNDRDLKFFDAVLATMQKDYKIDSKRIYCTGHSNGAVFTYDLWQARGDVFAAVAPVAGVALAGIKAFKPLPALHIAGEKDAIVPFKFQSLTMEGVRKVNGCESEGKPWATAGDLVGTIYASKTGTPFVSVIYPGGHTFPDEAPGLIVKFFKDQHKE
ncbi:MAG TPA: prolyl oligopeptidase family serine peptidase [Planctomycetota bacterium]|nr:prolyl oligopeptidase family serine peptidase [Planctomycetota bacterium]